MQNSRNKKALQIGLFILIAIVVLGVGYAAISSVNLIINGNATTSVNQNNFKVHFTGAQGVTGSAGVSGTSNIDLQDDTKATFDVTGLKKVGDYAEAVYTVRNDSNGIGAEITLNLTSSNTEYFKVTETILDDKLQAGEETTAKVRVEMIKTPITDAVSTSITATLTASPLEDAEAAGGDSQEEVRPQPVSYVYTVNKSDNQTRINQAIPNGVNQYNSFNNPDRTAFGYPASLAHILEGGLIKESYVAFERNGEVYYLRGGAGNESGQASMPVYDANVAVLKEAFPDWKTTCTDNTSSFDCSVDGFYAHAGIDGHVSASGSGWYCRVYGSGQAYCYS